MILAAAATQETVGRGVALLVAYSAGLGVPFLLSGLGMVKVFARLRPWLQPITIVSGLALAAFGVVMFTGQLSRWSSSLSRVFIDVPVLESLANI